MSDEESSAMRSEPTTITEVGQTGYEGVLRDVRLAAAALGEARDRADLLTWDAPVAPVLDAALMASRVAIATLMNLMPKIPGG